MRGQNLTRHGFEARQLLEGTYWEDDLQKQGGKFSSKIANFTASLTPKNLKIVTFGAAGGQNLERFICP